MPGRSTTGRSTPDAAGTLLAARIIAAAMLLGVVIFAIVAWFFLGDAFGRVDSGAASLLYVVWVGVAVAGIVGWSFARRKAMDATTARSRTGVEPGEASVVVLRRLIVAWVLLEIVAMFGIVVYGLTGRTTALLASVLLMGFGVAVTWPQEEWFPKERSG